MRAIRWHGREDVRLDEVAEPDPPGPGEILVDVEWCGICGTDVEEYTHGPIVIPAERPHPLTGAAAPITLGHEVVGRIAARGPGVSLPPDTLVALDGYLTCGTCPACRRNQPNRCETWGHIGLSAPGGLAHRLVVPAAMAVPAPTAVPSDHLALAEPFAVAVRAVRRAALETGDRALVVGGGTIGLAVLQVLLTSACREVCLVDPMTSRRALAAGFGATTAAGVADLLDGGLAGAFDIGVDCTGSAAAPVDALPLVRSGGRVVLVGLPVGPSTLDLGTLVLRELSLVGSVGHVSDEDTRTAVALLSSGRVDPAPLITHRLPLQRAVDDGIAALAGTARATALKMLVSPRLSTEATQ